ncbi:MAG: hypothetical protein IT371_26660 [Deltaproteobacteria bacterium]|nr:hypothetical protein [Deltaproteobacteria bacterium]
MRFRSLVWLASPMWLSACNGGGAPLPPSNWTPGGYYEVPGASEWGSSTSGGGGGIDGDWFCCKDANCERVDDSGLRIAGNKWTALDAPGSTLDANEEYCEVRGVAGSVEQGAGTVRILTANGGLALEITYSGTGDRVTAKVSDGSSSRAVTVPCLRVSPPRSKGPCVQDSPTPLPGNGSSSNDPPRAP